MDGDQGGGSCCRWEVSECACVCVCVIKREKVR